MTPLWLWQGLTGLVFAAVAAMLFVEPVAQPRPGAGTPITIAR